jgi:hypothetical protein
LPCLLAQLCLAAHVTRDVADGLDRAVAAQDQVGDQAGPAGLVERADRGAIVAVGRLDAPPGDD